MLRGKAWYATFGYIFQFLPICDEVEIWHLILSLMVNSVNILIFFRHPKIYIFPSLSESGNLNTKSFLSFEKNKWYNTPPKVNPCPCTSNESMARMFFIALPYLKLLSPYSLDTPFFKLKLPSFIRKVHITLDAKWMTTNSCSRDVCHSSSSKQPICFRLKK